MRVKQGLMVSTAILSMLLATGQGFADSGWGDPSGNGPDTSERVPSDVDQTVDWSDLSVTLDRDGTLHIPGGKVSSPESISMIDAAYGSVKKIIIEGPLVVRGSAHEMFAGLKDLTAIEGLNNLDTAGVTSMSEMFYGDEKLTSLDLSSLNTTNVLSMRNMFALNYALEDLNIANFDTKNVASMHGMFDCDYVLKAVDVSKFDTTNVLDMANMFYENNALTTLDVSGFNTAKVLDMSAMFIGDDNLTSLDVSGFDTAKVTNMESMFLGLGKLKELDVSGFDTTNVTDMRDMFNMYGTEGQLTSLDVSGFDTANVMHMGGMFAGNRQVKTIDVSHFDTSQVKDMYMMFGDDQSLTDLDLSNFNTAKVETMDDMFLQNYALEKVDLSTFDTSNVLSMYDMFLNANQLKQIKLGTNFKSLEHTALSEINQSGYSGKWQKVSQAGQGVSSKLWSSAELVNDYQAPLGAGTYVWQPTEKLATVTVKYQDEHGKTIHDDQVIHGQTGTVYTVAPEKIAGYIFDKSSGSTKGSFTDEDQQVVLTYRADQITEPSKNTNHEQPALTQASSSNSTPTLNEALTKESASEAKAETNDALPMTGMLHAAWLQFMGVTMLLGVAVRFWFKK